VLNIEIAVGSGLAAGIILSRDINIVEQIKDRVDVVETIGRIVQLKRTGKSWVGLCPFHKEKTPSFHVYEDSGNYMCFGCLAKGDIITFYMNYYHHDFKDACERLCNENAIEFSWGGSYAKDKTKDILYDVNLLAGKVYYDAIKTEGNPALEYMLGRGLDKRTISRFRIGWADDSGRMLAGRLEDDEKMQKAAAEVGLIYKNSGRYRDMFIGRVIFPIVNTRDNVIGFGGRDIKGESKAKYINSAYSSIYVKGTALYGLNITQGSIREQKFAIVVEGYMDLVMLHMHGVTNVCAPLGTAFTKQQAELLAKYTKSVVLAFDSDGAGQKAALASMDILAEAGLKVRVLVLEGAKDPDEYIRVFGKERFDDAVRRAVPMYDFKLDKIKAEYDITGSDGLRDFVKAAAEMIAPLGPVDRDYYMQKLSKDTGISENAITMQMDVSLAGSSQEKPVRESIKKTPLPSDDLLCGIIGLALESEQTFEKASEYRHSFSGTDFSGLMDAMLTIKGNTGAVPTAAELAEVLDEASLAVLDKVLRWAQKNTGNEENEQIDEYLAKLEIAELRVKEAELKETAGTDAILLKELMEIQKRIKFLENYIRSGRRGE